MICEARRAIAWTYPYGYFLNIKKKQLFEIMQNQMEHTLERTAKKIETTNFSNFISEDKKLTKRYFKF